MRVFSQGQLGQRLARALVALFVWSMLGSGIATLPASAQVSTRSAVNTQSTAVVPFSNSSAYHPDTLGLEVAALLAADLEERLALDVIGAEDVQAAMKLLGQSVPLDTPAKVRLASEIPTTMLVSGEIREAKLVLNKNQRFGQVTLAVHLFSRIAQGDVNGALVTAVSPGDMSASGDELINSALKQAVFQAITEMKTRPSVTAHVIWAKGDQIFTNASTRGGILVGMRMAAVRDSERIAEVLITSANGTGADGKVVSGSQLRTGDYLLALYDLPGDAPPPTVKEQVVHQAQGMEKLGVGVLALLLLSGAARGSSELANGNTNPADFRVSGLSNGVELGDSIPLFFPTNMVTWTKYSNTQSNRVLAYEIYRNGVCLALVIPGEFGEVPIYFDRGIWPQQGLPGSSWVDETITLQSDTGEFGIDGTSDSWDPADGTYGQWASDHLSFVGVTNLTYQRSVLMNPLLPNESVYYQTKPIIAVNRSSDPNFPQWEIENQTTMSAASNLVVPCSAAIPDQAMLVGSVASFLFYHPEGADEMVLQVQRDQGGATPVDFAPGLTTYQQTLSGVDPNLVGDLLTMQVPFATLQALTGTGDTYWWRIGARNRADEVKPRDWPLDPNSPDNGWVWSFPLQNIWLAPSLSPSLHSRDQDRALPSSGAGRNVRPTPGKRPYSTR